MKDQKDKSRADSESIGAIKESSWNALIKQRDHPCKWFSLWSSKFGKVHWEILLKSKLSGDTQLESKRVTRQHTLSSLSFHFFSSQLQGPHVAPSLLPGFLFLYLVYLHIYLFMYLLVPTSTVQISQAWDWLSSSFCSGFANCTEYACTYVYSTTHQRLPGAWPLVRLSLLKEYGTL